MAAAAILPALGLAGTALTAFGAIRQGQAEKAAADHQARQLDLIAKEQEAAGQQSVIEKRRQAEILQSRALAAAGASGAGTLDSNVLNIISGLAAESERDVQLQKHETASQAAKTRQQAAVSRFEGRQARQASRIRATGTAFSGLARHGTTLASRFNQDKPRFNQDKPRFS